METIHLNNKKISELLEIELPQFPKYAGPLMNLANTFSGGTKPKVVGQMSELIKKNDSKSYKEWEAWYLKDHPKAIHEAVEKISVMLKNFAKALEETDKKTIESWVRDLVIVKTFVGLKFQEAILKSVAEHFKAGYSLAAPKDEAKGIDGFINEKPVSIKPETYNLKKELSESIEAPIIFYTKTKTGIKISFPENLLN